jgi:hypothetical protein
MGAKKGVALCTMLIDAHCRHKLSIFLRGAVVGWRLGAVQQLIEGKINCEVVYFCSSAEGNRTTYLYLTNEFNRYQLSMNGPAGKRADLLCLCLGRVRPSGQIGECSQL